MIDFAKEYNRESSTKNVEQYYRFHARIYDATRWSFLFGRKKILYMIPDLPSQPKILEVGCGTGYNLCRMKKQLPCAQLTGVDLSADMLNIAQKKVGDSKNINLLKVSYGADPINSGSFDLILLSYSLTMMNQSYKEIIGEVTHDLSPDGVVAVVDFHNSPFEWFRRWMYMNHVNLNGDLLPLLQKYFCPVQTEVDKAYGGLWNYFKFVGKIRRSWK